jgi:hypothetical protein
MKAAAAGGNRIATYIETGSFNPPSQSYYVRIITHKNQDNVGALNHRGLLKGQGKVIDEGV